jgi:taurine dioxygenase
VAAPCVKPVGYALGAEVTGVDLSQPLEAGTLEAIRAAWLEHLVLVFPGQSLSPAQQVAFSRNFGELDMHDSQPFNRHADFPEVLLLTNRPVNGKPSQTYNAGQNWHTDLSYTVRPAKGTTLYCVEKPSVGGDTMFASASTRSRRGSSTGTAGASATSSCGTTAASSTSPWAITIRRRRGT